jgi:hypothetical protein
MQEISKDNPHALILNGPILNVDNVMIQYGDIKYTNGSNIGNEVLNYFGDILQNSHINRFARAQSRYTGIV